MPGWLGELLPIGALLVVIAVVVVRLPKVELGHSEAFKRRRFFNWFPLGLTYAFLYMGRYNLTVSKTALGDLMTNADFGTIFAVGTVTYGVSFIINGPLTDKLGGRKTILIAAAGSSAMNLVLGFVTWSLLDGATWATNIGLVPLFSVIYAVNMYFQSFGAVSIVKVNANWFHVNERGVIGGVFGILISLGVYFAYDWGGLIVDHMHTEWVFFVPSIILAGWVIIDFFVIRDLPSDAGHKDFNVGDATSHESASERLPVVQVFKKMVTNPIILIIMGIEFCSGFLRNAVMQWYLLFADQTGIGDTFVPDNWGLLLCMAGIFGGMFAGVISDKVFDSRRGPVAGILYAGLAAATIGLVFTLGGPLTGFIAIFFSLCVIGVHGMLSGTASMDFGGAKNAGVAVGIIDAMVYLGTALQAVIIGAIAPSGDAVSDPENWFYWPIVMIPASIIGFILALRIWNAKPKPGAASGH